MGSGNSEIGKVSPQFCRGWFRDKDDAYNHSDNVARFFFKLVLCLMKRVISEREVLKAARFLSAHR